MAESDDTQVPEGTGPETPSGSMDAALFGGARLSAETGLGTSRYSFTAQYVAGAVLLGRQAADIERLPAPTPLQQAEHRALVAAAVIQAAAAVEAEVNEILQYGAPHHLGSNPTATEAAAFLEPVADVVDHMQGVLDKWTVVLHLLRKPGIDRGKWPGQDAGMLVNLRNALIHYRSTSGGTLTPKKLLGGLKAMRFAPPPFVSEHALDFPFKILSAACAVWAAETAAGFIDAAYDRLGVPGVLDQYRGGEFAGLLPPKRS